MTRSYFEQFIARPRIKFPLRGLVASGMMVPLEKQHISGIKVRKHTLMMYLGKMLTLAITRVSVCQCWRIRYKILQNLKFFEDIGHSNFSNSGMP